MCMMALYGALKMRRAKRVVGYMTMQSWAMCPLCVKVFELEGTELKTVIDGHQRFICMPCQTKHPLLRAVAKPKGDIKPNGAPPDTRLLSAP